MRGPRFNLFDEVYHKSNKDFPLIIIGVIYVWQEDRYRYLGKPFGEYVPWEMNIEDDIFLIKKQNEQNCI